MPSASSAGAASENHARRKAKRASSMPRAAASAAGSRSSATRRPRGDSRARMARAWPPRPNVRVEVGAVLVSDHRVHRGVEEDGNVHAMHRV